MAKFRIIDGARGARLKRALIDPPYLEARVANLEGGPPRWEFSNGVSARTRDLS